MGWDVLNGLKRFKQITFLRLLGETVGTAASAKALLKDIDGHVILARTSAAISTLQKRRGFAKGCILLVDASGPAHQNTKGLYENVGTALLSRFNVVGQVTDPEFLLDNGRLLIGDANGIARAKAISGVIAVSNTGVTSFNALYASTHRLIAAGISASENDADASVVVSNALIASTDVVIGTLAAAANVVYVTKAVAGTGSATFTLSGNGGAGTQVNYAVLRTVNT